jgi:hypothetical protein
MSRALLLALILALGVAGAAPAQAHAFLEHAEPAVGAKVATAPAAVRITFTEKLEPAFSSIKVLDAGGHEVDKADLRAETGNAAILRVSLPALSPGVYRVTWRATSVDTHVTKGEFTFEVQGS